MPYEPPSARLNAYLPRYTCHHTFSNGCWQEFGRKGEASGAARTPATAHLEDLLAAGSNPLLALVNNLQNGKLDDTQRKIVAELRHGILALES